MGPAQSFKALFLQRTGMWLSSVPKKEKAVQNLAVRSVTGAQETFEHYQKSTGFGAEARVAAALAKWGPNTFVVPLPTFADMLKEQLLAPFFVFQVFCVGLWCLDDYW